MKKIILKRDREKSLLRRHPWVFSGAVHSMDDFSPGETGAVWSHRNEILGFGYVNSASQITCRILSFGDSAPDFGELIRLRIIESFNRRAHILADDTTGCRIVSSDADHLPGLIIDKFSDCFSVQILTAGMERFRSVVWETLEQELDARLIVDKSDEKMRRLEGLAPIKQSGDQLVTRFKELGLDYEVDLSRGQKTGYYFDQRDNRSQIRSLAHTLATKNPQASMLDAFCYVGSFGLNAAKGGIRNVTCIDQSQSALDQTRNHYQMNQLPEPEMFCGDGFSTLRQLVDQERKFDLIVMDPPKFAKGKKDLNRASRAYKDVNLQAFKLLNRGGYLATFSCSGNVTQDLFQKILFGAAIDAKCDATIESVMIQSTCHPVALTVPESLYLKGLLVRKL